MEVENKTHLNEQKTSCSNRVFYIVSLSLTTIILLVVFVTNGLASYPDPAKVGFKNMTGKISDIFYTQVTPAGWTFSLWGIIYTFQVIWIIYGWSFVFRPSSPSAISAYTYIFYSCANICNIIWIYVWGNEYPQAAFPVIVIFGIFLYIAIGVEAKYLFDMIPALESASKYKIDIYIARYLVLNSIAIYATWVTVATLLNFAIVLQYYADLSAANAGTVALSILTVELVVYFILEITILDAFARFVVIVYPVLIWANSGIISAQWGTEDNSRNSIFTLVLLIASVIIFITKIVLIIVFSFVRPLRRTSKVVVVV